MRLPKVHPDVPLEARNRPRGAAALGLTLSAPENARHFGYYVTNESAAFRVMPAIKNIGGGYIGGGAELNYSYIAAAKSSHAVLIDIERGIGDVHRLYRAIHLANPTREGFLRDLFGTPEGTVIRRESFAAMVDSASARARQNPNSYRSAEQTAVAQKLVKAGLLTNDEATFASDRLRLIALRGRLLMVDANCEQHSWLASEAKYQHVRNLFLNDRIVIATNDLSSDFAPLASTFAKANALGDAPVRLVYTSNIEDYVQGDKHAQMRRNFGTHVGADLERALIIRVRDDTSNSISHELNRFAEGLMTMRTSVHSLKTWVSTEGRLSHERAHELDAQGKPLKVEKSEKGRLVGALTGAVTWPASDAGQFIARASALREQLQTKPSLVPPQLHAAAQYPPTFFDVVLGEKPDLKRLARFDPRGAYGEGLNLARLWVQAPPAQRDGYRQKIAADLSAMAQLAKRTRRSLMRDEGQPQYIEGLKALADSITAADITSSAPESTFRPTIGPSRA